MLTLVRQRAPQSCVLYIAAAFAYSLLLIFVVS